MPNQGGKGCGKYRTARFVLVHTWSADHPRHSGRPFRVGYARCSVATQGLASQVDALKHVERSQVLSERVSIRIKIHPELQDAIRLARGINGAAPDQRVILTVREMKRLARNAAEFMTGTDGTNKP